MERERRCSIVRKSKYFGERQRKNARDLKKYRKKIEKNNCAQLGRSTQDVRYKT